MLLPWLVGLVLLLLLAVAAALLVGRAQAQRGVDSSVLNAQESVAASAAESVRRSANEAAADLESAMTLLEAAPTAPLDTVLQALMSANARWETVVVVEPDRRTVVASTGGVGAARFFSDRLPSETVISTRTDVARPVVTVSTSLQRVDDPSYVVLAEVRPGVLGRALSEAAPGEAWLVDADGRVIADLGGGTRPTELPNAAARAMARVAVAGSAGSRVVGGSGDRAQIMGWAPVRGHGLAGNLDWAVVTSRNVSDFAPTGTDYQTRGLLFGLLLALITVVIFVWLRVAVLNPILRMAYEAERVAYGDLSRPVLAQHSDEVGRIADALERIRRALQSHEHQRGTHESDGER